MSAVVCGGGGGGGVVLEQLSRTHERSWPWALFAHLTQTLSEPCLAASQASRPSLNQFHRGRLSNAPMPQLLFHDSAAVFPPAGASSYQQGDSKCPRDARPRFTWPVSVSTLVAASAHVARS